LKIDRYIRQCDDIFPLYIIYYTSN